MSKPINSSGPHHYFSQYLNHEYFRHVLTPNSKGLVWNHHVDSEGMSHPPGNSRFWFPSATLRGDLWNRWPDVCSKSFQWTFDKVWLVFSWPALVCGHDSHSKRFPHQSKRLKEALLVTREPPHAEILPVGHVARVATSESEQLFYLSFIFLSGPIFPLYL